MNWKQIKWRIKYFFQFFPFTLNTFLCAIAVWLAYKVLYKPLPKAAEEPAPFLPFIVLMGKLALWFVLALIALSILSAIGSWLYYLWLKSRNHTMLELQFNIETRQGKRNKLFLNAQLKGVIRPLLGFVKGRLVYDNNEMTDTFSLLSGKRKEGSMWRAAIAGRSRLNLPDIKEYELKGGFVYFEDMLRLLSLSVPQQVNGQFYQPPVLAEEEERNVFPKKTETTDIRIEQLRRVEGEHLNYKDFESGDDVRRIVWKIYAKNRDLVVRVPEMFQPYASHLYFYASFHADMKGQWLREGYLKEMLNYYKNAVWTVYDALAAKEWEMRYIPDQNFTIPEYQDEAEKNARIISNSSWHTDKDLSQYFNPKTGAVLCISSLTDPKDLQNILDQCEASTVVYFIKTSNVFRHTVAWNWFKRLLFLPPGDRLSQLRSRWVFSPMRLKVQNREKQLEEILNKSHISAAVI